MVALAIPAAVFDLYYFRVLGEPILLYRIRSVPGSEILASLSGLLAGWIQARVAPRLKLSPLWYLARALHRHGWVTGFLLSDPGSVPLPAVAGVRLKSLGNSGHFIALLKRQENQFVLADPMEGLSLAVQ
jgi:hypothetical protein